MKKCKGIGEVAFVAVAEVGVRMTRAKTALPAAKAAAVESTERKRKVGVAEFELSRPSAQLKSPRLAIVTPDNSASAVNSESLSCASISSNQVFVSCCSSNGLSEMDKESFKFLDLEENGMSAEEIATSTGDLVDCSERREMIPSAEVHYETGELESTARPHEVSSRHRSVAEKMPSEVEIEEFFAAAEKDLQKQFADKYNYDIVKDEPLKGRYEWVPVQVKP